ncbi:MAG TPA: hypothetical protein VFA99_08255 [Acidobacteriaceae bacterium]|nr:hypothetical protein [Acidobacteriaceae bacterium]
MALFGYNILLMALFILGLLADDGFGWAFLPLLLCTAPWSFIINTVLLHAGFAAGWFDGLIGNFILFVVLCGGTNSALLYLLITRVIYPKAVKTPPLTP